MNYKIKGAFRKNKIPLIFCIILWLVLTIVFVVPVAFSIYAASLKGSFDGEVFVKMFGKSVTQPFNALGLLFKKNAVGTLLGTEFGFTLIYAIIFFIGFAKSAPKHEYEDFEHGSSDWSKRGEQYQILNKNQGIILAENNYLPVDKRGNVNVLVVGRIRFW